MHVQWLSLYLLFLTFANGHHGEYYRAIENMQGKTYNETAADLLYKRASEQLKKIIKTSEFIEKYRPRYATQEEGSIPSVYYQNIKKERDWLRIRIQHEHGPTIDGPHLVYQYCGDNAQSLDFTEQLTQGTFIDAVKQVPGVSQSYECWGKPHLEVFVDEYDKISKEPHLSGGTITNLSSMKNSCGFEKYQKALHWMKRLYQDLCSLTKDETPSNETKFNFIMIQNFFVRTKQATLAICDFIIQQENQKSSLLLEPQQPQSLHKSNDICCVVVFMSIFMLIIVSCIAFCPRKVFDLMSDNSYHRE